MAQAGVQASLVCRSVLGAMPTNSERRSNVAIDPKLPKVAATELQRGYNTGDLVLE
jgi:hypothetical protein